MGRFFPKNQYFLHGGNHWNMNAGKALIMLGEAKYYRKPSSTPTNAIFQILEPKCKNTWLSKHEISDGWACILQQ